MKRTFRLTLLAIIFAAPITLFAQGYKSQISIKVENDQYINPKNDRYYTAGEFASYTRALDHSSDSSLVKKVLEIDGGQQIYNAYESNVADINLQDRPYTAYLYAGISLTKFYKNESALKLGGQLGIIGPLALGEEIQKGFHSLFGLHEVKGWEHQLNNEPGINLNADYKKLLYRTNGSWFDITANPSAWLGNTFTGASAGMLFRIGQLGNLFESVSTNSRVSVDSKHQKHELFFFAVPQLHFVGYNATIQGGLFRSDKGPLTFGIHHFVYVQQLGLQFASDRWSASAIAFIKSREVKSTAPGYQYGSISFAYRWGKNL
ncbi:lipid A deacylase LpxR family protein [Mucilaginibacter limnophilus]|uniref:Lipid A deacylase LpxR family protein n=1 Tax=Mucilaginibacter limnophilus TaxID=1932778 RepID=A0A437MYM7_9SPHI|nr:lipid A deacylase LpxR family protein [Mucilaginibacter limnophilus]RVU02781.1 lipid A deacylase LpxR family protein [Mucilaginibacter limnophilus]